MTLSVFSLTNQLFSFSFSIFHFLNLFQESFTMLQVLISVTCITCSNVMKTCKNSNGGLVGVGVRAKGRLFFVLGVNPCLKMQDTEYTIINFATPT